MVYIEAIRDMDANKHRKHDEGLDGLPDELLQEIIPHFLENSPSYIM